MRSENLQRLRRQVHMRQVASKPTRRAIEVGPATSMDPSSASRREHRSLNADFDGTTQERARGIVRELRCHPPTLAFAEHPENIRPRLNDALVRHMNVSGLRRRSLGAISSNVNRRPVHNNKKNERNDAEQEHSLGIKYSPRPVFSCCVMCCYRFGPVRIHYFVRHG